MRSLMRNEVNKKLNNQLKQVTSQLNRAKKQIETLNEMNIIFKKNPPENPELIDMIKELEINYEEMLQKKDQEITNLKIRNSSYDYSHSQELSDQKSELLRMQLENQFLNEKIDSILEENEKLKQQLKSSHSQQSSIKSQPQYRLVTKVVQQEPFSAFTDYQFLGKNNIQNSQNRSDSPQRTSNQNSQEFMQALKKIEKIQQDGQFTPEKVLSQIRLSATLLHLKRMELPNDLNDTYVKYLNQIEESDAKSEDKSDLASTVKPKKLFSKNEENDTQQKQIRSQSTKSNNQKPLCSNKKNQFVQVDFLDKKQLDKTQNDLENLQNEFQQLQKQINQKPTNESHQKNITQSDIKNSLESDELLKQFQKDNISKLKDSLNRQSDYSFKDLQAQSNQDKSTIQQLKRQVENLEEQLQYLKVQNQRQSYLIKQLQDKNNKDREKSDEFQMIIKEENENLNSTILTLQKELNNLKKGQLKICQNESIQTENLSVKITQESQTNQSQFQQDKDQQVNLSSQFDKQKMNESDSQNMFIQELDEQIQKLKQDNQDLLENSQQQELLKQEINSLKQVNVITNQAIQDLQLQNDKLQKDLDIYKCAILNQNQNEDNQLCIKVQKMDQEIQMSQKEIEIKKNNQEMPLELQEQINLLHNLLEQSKLELQQKQNDLDQLQCDFENLTKEHNQLQQKNDDLQQIFKEQESEYQTQLSLIKLRLSALEEQQVKEHSRSISISENGEQLKETNKQPDFNLEDNKNNDLEIQIRRLLDEKAVLYDQMQKQQQDFKSQIKILSEDFEFQKLQLNEKIKELESKIVLYVDGDQKLMQENQNLANQVQNLARQQNKIQSQKKLQSATSSPRVQIENQQQIQIIKDLENEISQLRNNQEQMQLESNNIKELFNQQQNENQELKHEVLTLQTENSFEKQENQRLKQQIISNRDQLLMLNKQLDLNKKNNKKEIDYLNSQIDQYKFQLTSSYSKISSKITKDQSTQINGQIYVIDQSLLDEKENIIHNLKKSLQSKDHELDQTIQNLLITRQELFKANDQLLKLRTILRSQEGLQTQVNQSRQYNDCALYPQRQNRIISIKENTRISTSEQRHKNHSLDKLESASFWKRKYEEVLQQSYINSQFNSQNTQYKIKFEELQLNCQSHLKDLENQKDQNRQLLLMIETKLSNNNNSNQFNKYEQEIQTQRKQLEKLNLELDDQKILCKRYQKEFQDLQQKQLQARPVQIVETNKEDIENYVNQIFNAKQENLELVEINQNQQNQILDLKKQLKENNDQLIILKQQYYQSTQLLDELKFANSQLIQENQQLLLFKSDQEKQILLLTKSEQDQQYKLSYSISQKKFERSKDFNFNRSEIMHNLDVIRQELKVYQSKCQIQEFEISQLKLQLQQPIPQQKLISPNKYKEQYEYLNEILKELEITKLQNENLRKQNTELFDYQSKLIYENDNLKRLNINSPLSSPRIQYQSRNSQQRDERITQNENLNQQIDQLYQRINTARISEIEDLKHELDILKRQVLSSSTQVKEAESLSLQARVLTLENQLQSSQNQIENLKEIIQENQELKQQIRSLKESNQKIQQMFTNNQKIQQSDLSQTERLNRELSEKISELTQLKIKYKQALTIMQKMENRQMQ
ncbi:unnamed protein product (macronuclear) [Paramecium tetraurelia]|uniref:Uncharacterized protein n=1 Tax=Paramecium tetraurelia TaxID=5888 RepID=A0BNU4_PARTE|nr:uncharacterized protein GSPATT00030850001 [Paramecium tetraurelia]CAK60211.1 unnamed protein product [Paramecium tetraurelia]|eukprot:XP_001427609.1 hypothetical protein (macronuclear) [Paramecium tetraurelia strain d4-2]